MLFNFRFYPMIIIYWLVLVAEKMFKVVSLLRH
jgi:hypothetical protein